MCVIGTQSCLTLCDPMDHSVHRIFKVRILERVAIPSPGDLPKLRIKPGSPAWQADSLPSEPPGKPHNYVNSKLALFLVTVSSSP